VKVGENKPAVQAREQEREERATQAKSLLPGCERPCLQGLFICLGKRLTNLNVQRPGIAPPRDSSLKKIHPKSKGLDFKLV
jgi:hypothetical protein